MKHAWFTESVRAHAESYISDMLENNEDATPSLETFVQWLHRNTTLEKKPYWHDHCNHTTGMPFAFSAYGFYIGSFTINEEKYDVYTFVQHGEDYTCIRFGNEASEYNSPGSVKSLGEISKNHPDSTLHVTAYSMILEHKRKQQSE